MDLLLSRLVGSPHVAIICCRPESGKTRFVLDLLEGPFRGVFEHIVFLCPSIPDNETYLSRSRIWTDPEILLVDLGKRLHVWLKFFVERYRGEDTLYVVDDMASSKALNQKKTMLSEIATRGRHPKQSLWVLTQTFNAVVLEVRAQTKWVALFHCKDKFSFDEVCDENDVLTREERAEVKRLLATTEHAKLIPKTDPPAAWKVLI